MKSRSPMPLRALALGAAMALAAPALAQSATPPEEIIVTGAYGTVPDSVRSLSQSVSYADLDLGSAQGKKMLRQRVNLTARFLCEKLGESDISSPPVPSCRDAAVKDAMARVDTLEAGAAPRDTTWVAGPAWQAPYPADWARRYP